MCNDMWSLCLQVVLSFYEKRVRQQWGLAFGKQEERLFWEQWCARLFRV
jgi:Autophagy-related protein 101